MINNVDAPPRGAAEASGEAADAPDTVNLRRTILASVIGTIAEYYDFFIYGTASALVFNKVFFQPSIRWWAPSRRSRPMRSGSSLVRWAGSCGGTSVTESAESGLWFSLC